MNDPNDSGLPPSSTPYSRSRQAGEAQAMLGRIENDFTDNPESMRYFYDLFDRVYCRGAPLDHS
ncbi:MAG: hypothetical protein P8178_16385, partial [Candidatus Thiodiazotropha sp.]